MSGFVLLFCVSLFSLFINKPANKQEAKPTPATTTQTPKSPNTENSTGNKDPTVKENPNPNVTPGNNNTSNPNVTPGNNNTSNPNATPGNNNTSSKSPTADTPDNTDSSTPTKKLAEGVAYDYDYDPFNTDTLSKTDAKTSGFFQTTF